MSGPVEIMVIIAAVAYVLISRLMGQPAEAKRMLILPAVLVVVGLSNVEHVTGIVLWFLVATAVLSAAIGALRGASVKLYQQDGVVFMRYTWVSIVLWVVNVAAKFGANFLLGSIDPSDANHVGNTLYLTLGLGMLVEGAIVLGKAVRTDGRILWAKGKRGAPHRTSPWLDDMQRRFTDRRP